jgi:hypothetical protein
MSPSLRNYLQHINDEVQYLQTVTTGLDKTDFLANDTLKRAVVRSLDIILVKPLNNSRQLAEMNTQKSLGDPLQECEIVLFITILVSIMISSGIF